MQVENDANLGALAELFWGAGKDAADLVYLKVATGRRRRPGRRAAACSAAPAAPPARSATPTIDERRPASAAAATAAAWRPSPPAPAIVELLRRSLGHELTIEEIVERADGGRPGLPARDRRRRAATSATRSLADVCNLFNPQRVVVGGSVGQAGDLLLDEMREAVAPDGAVRRAEDVEIVPGVLGERAEVLGATALILAGGGTQRGPRRRGVTTSQRGESQDVRRTTEERAQRRLPSSRSVAGGAIAGCGDDDDDGGGGDSAGGGGGGGKIALLLPESKTARYESQDRPLFEEKVKELCPDCEIIYSQRRPGRGQAAAAGRGGADQGRQGARARPGRRGLGRRRSSRAPSSRRSR